MDFYGRYASAVNGGFNYRTARPLALAANFRFPPLSTEGAAALTSPSLAKCLEHTVEDLGFFTF